MKIYFIFNERMGKLTFRTRLPSLVLYSLTVLPPSAFDVGPHLRDSQVRHWDPVPEGCKYDCFEIHSHFWTRSSRHP